MTHIYDIHIYTYMHVYMYKRIVIFGLNGDRICRSNSNATPTRKKQRILTVVKLRMTRSTYITYRINQHGLLYLEERGCPAFIENDNHRGIGFNRLTLPLARDFSMLHDICCQLLFGYHGYYLISKTIQQNVNM